VTTPSPRRAASAAGIAMVGAPAALLAHLLTTGVPASARTTLLVVLVVAGIAAVLPARTVRGLALVTGLTQLAAHALLALSPPASGGGEPACLPAVGRAASLGLEFAVLRTDAACTGGMLAVAPPAAVVLTALLVATAILAGNTVLALATGLLLGRALSTRDLLTGPATLASAALARTARLLLAAVPLTPRPRPVPALPRRAQARPPHPLWHPAAILLRGPPARRAVLVP
jgi:hypothetical protein